MSKSTRSALVAVGIAFAVVVTPLAAGVGPAGVGTTDVAPAGDAVSTAESGDSASASQETQPVRIENVRVESVTLQNVTVTNVTVRRAGQRRNVTLQNVSLRRITVQQADLFGVEPREAVLREKALLDDLGVPYARGADVTNASRQQLSVQDRPFDGVVIERLAVGNATGLKVSVPADATENVSADASAADLVIEEANVSLVEEMTASTETETA